MPLRQSPLRTFQFAAPHLRHDGQALFRAFRVRLHLVPYAQLEGKLEEMERELVGEALTARLGFARFCAQEIGLEAEKLLEAVARPFAEGVRDLEELSARHEVEADVEGVEEYLVMMTEAWCRGLESA